MRTLPNRDGTGASSANEFCFLQICDLLKTFFAKLSKYEPDSEHFLKWLPSPKKRMDDHFKV
jgi:hypothetical protein